MKNRSLLETTIENALETSFYSKFYRNSDKKNFHSLPFLTPISLVENNPFDFVPSRYKEKVRHQIHSSGTTSRPKTILLTEQDIDLVGKMTKQCLEPYIDSKFDKVMTLSLKDHATSLLPTVIKNEFKLPVYVYQISKLEEIISLCKDKKANFLFISPLLLQRLKAICDSKNIMPKSLGIKKIVFIGSKISKNIEEMALAEFCSETRSAYALTETCGPIAIECECKNGMHLLPPEYGIWTIIGKKKEVSTEGELIITLYNREGTRLIKYCTGDYVRVINKPCNCKYGTEKIEILGRTDDMITIGYINLFWTDALEKAVLSLPINDYYIEIYNNRKGSDIMKFYFDSNEQISESVLMAKLSRANKELYKQIEDGLINLEIENEKLLNKLMEKRLIDRR